MIRTIVVNAHGQNNRFDFQNQTSAVLADNKKGKTSLLHAIECLIGDSDQTDFWHLPGFEEVDSIEAEFEGCSATKNSFWMKKDKDGNLFYRPDSASVYCKIPGDQYDSRIFSLLPASNSTDTLSDYHSLYGEKLTPRAFNFLNTMEETSIGNLSLIFSYGALKKNRFRLSSLMHFCFERKKELLKIQLQKKLDEIDEKLDGLAESKMRRQILLEKLHEDFLVLNLGYGDSNEKNEALFLSYLSLGTEGHQKPVSNDVSFLSLKIGSLDETIKRVKQQKEETESLLTSETKRESLELFLENLASQDERFKEILQPSIDELRSHDQNLSYLGYINYEKTLEQLESDRKGACSELEELQNQKQKVTFDEKTVAIQDAKNCFAQLRESRAQDTDIDELTDEKTGLKNRLRELQHSKDSDDVDKLNSEINAFYKRFSFLKIVNDDLQQNGFYLDYDPVGGSVMAIINKGIKDREKTINIGSQAVEAVVQFCIYASVIKTVLNVFSPAMVLPILLVDGFFCPFGGESKKDLNLIFKEMSNISKELGFQLILFSACKKEELDSSNFICSWNDANKGVVPCPASIKP